MAVRTVLHNLARSKDDNLRDIQKYLKIGSNVNKRDIDGNRPLHLAALNEKDNVQDVQELINAGANVNATNNYGSTALHFAVIRRKYRVIELLLKAEIDVDIQDDLENSALHYAVDRCAGLQTLDHTHVCPVEHVHSDIWIVRELLSWDADIDLFGRNDETPLMWAIRDNNLEVVRNLVKFGACVTVLNKYMKTPLHFMLDRPQPNISMMLKLMNSGNYEKFINGCMEDFICYIGHRHRGSLSNQLAIAKAFVKCKVLLYVDAGLNVRRDHDILPKLEVFANEAFFEVERMLNKILIDDLTVYEIILKRFTPVAERKRAFATDMVFNMLLTDYFPIYSDFIVNQIKISFLKKKLGEVKVYVRSETDGKRIVLNTKVTSALSTFLSNTDIFNLIKVYY
ncbi:ankyrin repeat protein RF_0381 [Caerostris darwini]|uniref:Ankyrin repeat protein RF_0381 n=1 Tax=Caerostris darwini TaxID=1538125 RepID=A0AAV4UAU5_9ARAC|nr:ankyrin repeat protein RF_0381 [Caerostris darwini]